MHDSMTANACFAPYNFTLLVKPHCGLKLRKMNWMFHFPVMKLSITRFYARLFVLISSGLGALKLRNTVFTLKVLVQQHGAVVAMWSESLDCKLLRLSCGILDKLEKEWLRPFLWQHICTQWIQWNILLSLLNEVKVTAKKKVFSIFFVTS